MPIDEDGFSSQIFHKEKQNLKEKLVKLISVRIGSFWNLNSFLGIFSVPSKRLI